jgi:hypothetical protein
MGSESTARKSRKKIAKLLQTFANSFPDFNVKELLCYSEFYTKLIQNSVLWRFV